MSRIALLLLISAILVSPALPAAKASRAPDPASAPAGLLIVTFDIQVDMGASDYVQRAVATGIAESKDIVIVMNTPGGLLGNMQEIVSSIGEAQVNGRHVYTFVPPNDFAASAGSYIALATNAIYMGSGSIIGPSTPIVVGGTPEEQQHVQGAMLSYIESLAQANGYNVSATIPMVEDERAYTADEALNVGLITGRAETLDGMLTALGLSSLPRTNYDEPIYDRFLSFLADPTVDGLFILVGVIALVLDLLHRTLLLTIVAVIMIALGLVGAQIIGASVFGLLVLLIAAALVFLEIKAGHGLFATAGILLGLGGTYLLASGVKYSPSPFGVGQYVLMGLIGGTVAVGFIYLSRIRRSLMLQPKLIDPALVVNKTGRAVTDIVPGRDGVANVDAEDFTAISANPIEKGSLVKVTSFEEGKIRVEKVPVPGTGPAESKSAA